MGKAIEKVMVGSIALTPKEKAIYDKVVAMGKTTASDLEGQCGDLNIFSIRSTLARLEKHHGLLVKGTSLVGEKAVSNYSPKAS